MEIDLSIGDFDFTLDISILAYGYFKPAKLTGHPDSWYPEESDPTEWEIDSITDYTETKQSKKCRRRLLRHEFTQAEEDQIDELVDLEILAEYENSESWDY